MRAVGLAIGLILVVSSVAGLVTSISELHDPILNGDIGGAEPGHPYVREISTKGTPMVVTVEPFGPGNLTVYLDGEEIALDHRIETNDVGLHELRVTSPTTTLFRLHVYNDGIGTPALALLSSYLALGTVILVLARWSGGPGK